MKSSRDLTQSDMSVEIQQLKQRIAKLEEENATLRAELAARPTTTTGFLPGTLREASRDIAHERIFIDRENYGAFGSIGDLPSAAPASRDHFGSAFSSAVDKHFDSSWREMV